MKKKNNDISFLGRIILFFKTLNEKIRNLHFFDKFLKKQKALAGYENEESPIEAKLSFGLGIARVVSISALCLLLALVLIFGGRIVSYENVYYMFKDISYISSFNESRPGSLSYSQPFSRQDFASFKNGLAVVSDSEIKFFTSTGRTSLTAGSGYTNPKICTSNDYVLIYDQGRRSYSIYNSFISVFSETLDFPISYADMSPDGSFCIVTKSGDYGSVVRIYDNQFNLEAQYSKNDYILSAELSENGKHIVILSLDASEGESKVSLTVLKRGDSKPLHTEVLNGLIPYKATFVSNDRIALICSDSSSVYDLRGNRKDNFVYPYELVFAKDTYEGYAFVFNENGVSSESFVVCFNENGSLAYSRQIDDRIYDMQLYGKYVYLLLENEILRIDSALGITSSAHISSNDGKLVIFSESDVAVCTKTTAYCVTFNQ